MYSPSAGSGGGGRRSLVFDCSIGATCALGTVLGFGEVMLMHFGADEMSVEHMHKHC